MSATSNGPPPVGRQNSSGLPMSASSSMSSNMSSLWSKQSSRRGSDASSIAPSFAKDTAEALSQKTVASRPTSSVPMAVSTSETRPARPTQRPVHHTADPLGRKYPKPADELDIHKALAREPLKWTLGHWKKNGQDVTQPAWMSLSSPAAKQRFEDAKEELRRAQRDMAKR